MNFGEGFTFPENELQLFGDSRTPATLIKSIATRTQRQILVDGQGNKLGTSNWREQIRVSNGPVQNYAGSVHNFNQNTQLGRNGGSLNRNVGLSNLESGLSGQYVGLLNQNNGVSNHDASLSTQNVNLLNYDARLVNHYDGLSNRNAGLANSGSSLSRHYHGLSNHDFTLSNQKTGMPNCDARLSNQCTSLSNQDVSFTNGDVGFSNQNTGFSNPDINVLTRHVGPSNQNALSSNRDVSFSNQNIASSNRNVGYSNQNANLSIRDAGLSNRGVVFPNQSRSLSNQNSGMSNSYAGVSNQNVSLSNQISGTSNGDPVFFNRDMGLSNYNMGSSKGDASLSNRDMGLTNHNMGSSNHNAVLSNRGVGLSNHNISILNQDLDLSNHNMGVSNGNVGQSHQDVQLPIGNVNQSKQEVSLPQRKRVINHIANTYAQTPDYDNAGANNITLADILAFRNAGSVSAATSTINRNNDVRITRPAPNLQAQANRHQNQSSTIEMFSVNNSYCQSTSLLNNSDNYANITKDGFPMSNRPQYNLNSPPTAANDASTTGIGNPFRAPGQTQQSDQNQLHNILNFSVDENLHQETNKRDDLLVAPMGSEAIEKSNEELLQSIFHPSSVDVASLDDTNKVNDQGIDLNKTPQQKAPKRRKHRPKVVREGKSERGAKPVTPQDSSTKQTPTGKRKYVRKNDKESTTPKENVMDKTVDPPVRTSAKSCRRALNFDFEKSTDESHGILVSQTKEVENGNERCINLNINAQEIEEYSETDIFSGKASAKRMNQYTDSLSHFRNQNPSNCVGMQNQCYPQAPATTLQDMPVNNLSILRNAANSQHSAPNGTSQWVGYGSVYQKQIHPEGLGQIFFQPKRTDDNLDRSGKLMLQSSPQSVLHNMVDSNEERAYKRKYHPTMDRINHEAVTIHSLLCQEVINVDEYDEHLNNLREGIADAQKRRRFESEHTTNFPTFMYPVTDGSRQHTPNGAIGVNPNLLTPQMNDRDLSSHLESNNAPRNISHGDNRFTLDRYRPPPQNGYVKQHNSTQLVPYMPATAYMQSKRSTQDNTTTSMNGKCNYSPPPPHKRTPKSSDMKEVGSRSAKMPAKVTRGPSSKALLQDKNANHNPTSQYTNKGLSERKNYLVLIDEIISRLACLKLDDKSNKGVRQEEKALVPYKADGTIIPYEGYQIKKKQPRPKVNLDPETERLWKLLMGKEQSEASEGTDKDKEKWWEEERRVFSGRADSFIARMHLVQGDRRFSRWKGSVVDSVIGVFLTQNVSDHLSSSAFMSLSARFPIRSSSNNNPSCYRNEKPIMVEEPELSILGADDTIGQQEKVSRQPVYSQISHVFQELLDQKGNDLNLGLERTSLVEANDKIQEEVISAPNSVHTFIHQANGGLRMISLSREEAEEQGIVLKPEQTYGSVPRNPVPPRKVGVIQDLHRSEYERPQLNDNKEQNHNSILNTVDSHSGCLPSAYTVVPNVTSSSYMLHNNQCSAVLDFGMSGRDVSSQPCYASSISSGKDINSSNNVRPHTESIYSPTLQLDGLLRQQETLRARWNAQSTSHLVQQQSSSHQGNFKEIHQQPSNNTQHETIKDFPWKNTFTTGSVNDAEKVDVRGISNMQENLNTCNLEREAFDTRPTIVKNKAELPNKKSEQKINGQNHSLGEATKGKTTTTLKAHKGKSEDGKKSEIDWDGLRKQVEFNIKRDRTADRMDSLDYEAVRCADVKQISDTIKERGMNNMLAERMKAFLNRLVKDHGSIDLEWLRDAPPDKAKEYLLSIRGLGLKSVECVRLLTLHHLAFPVDTNVGRIAVRLGWVPLQPLPESLQLHLLEMYPMLESIQKYLWPRLCKLDQRTLYELHYQMITFGKVFCTKSRPNCNACPMRGECRHFASAFASARLALPGPEEKSIVNSSFPIEGGRNPAVVINPVPLLTPGEDIYSRQCEPIIEVPATPEPESVEISESDIEDAFYEDSEEIPTIKLNVEELTQNLQYYMQENSQDGDMSKALVVLNAAAASLPTPKLKNVSRLRTEHQVYELPDSHPLLKGMDRREPDDPSPYLLAIWAPGETADSTLPTENKCTSQDPNKLCGVQTCFSCNSNREANSLTVRGTLLIPCRTAMRGSFPLNGTYFQVNEMFADDESSVNPIAVPRAWIWNLQRRTVYFGTSVSTIFRGLSTEGIQYCFWRGFVCVRGFDQKEKTPRPLRARLHLPASRLAKNKNEKK